MRRSRVARYYTGLVLLLSTSVSWGQAEPPPATSEQADFFETRIRPVLAERCWSCHGPDKQTAGLRLDSRADVLKGGDMGPAVVPGDLEESLLVVALRHDDDFLKMPPKEPLAAEVVADFENWIGQGALWPEGNGAAEGQDGQGHWAFQPVVKPPVPDVANPDGLVNPIDAFVQARLEKAGLTPSDPEPRASLLRRASFDLTGLPPTPEEIAAFEQDTEPEAFERQIERLLASPQYGERWGRHWMDVARYSDTKGYVFQEERRYPFAYTYRDWLIRSLNDDMPYDRFVQLQLAADRLVAAGEAQPADQAAMGFLTLGRRFLNNIHDITDDRIDVTTRGLLGLTVACARCHNHKYDPISAQDYYALHGIFLSSEEPGELPLIPQSDAAETDETRDYQAQHAARAAEVEKLRGEIVTAIQGELRTKLGTYFQAAGSLGFDPRHADLDARARERELRPELVRYAAFFWGPVVANEQHEITGPLFQLLRDAKGFPAEEFTAKLSERRGGLAAQWGPPSVEASDPRHAWLEGVTSTGPDSYDSLLAGYGALLDRALATEPSDPALGKLRASLEIPGGPILVDPEKVRMVINRDERQRIRDAEKQVAALDASHPGAPPRAMVMVDKENLYQPRVFLRGNPGRPGDEVPRRFLTLIDGPEPPAYTEGSGRLELARAITRPDNPLTARVLVNRVWTQHFGEGLVNTPSDFGLRSDPPTHPELLDWLAATFVEEGWSLKKLHALILSSRTYRQQSRLRPECATVDPENRLLWRFNRHRLELEPLRDAILMVSGRLDRTVGGRSVGITEAPFSTRRSVYAYIDRQNLEGFFRAFDLATPDATSPRRFVTTVPQQALFLINSPFLAEQSRALASRLDREAGSDPAARIDTLYRWLFGRVPSAEETNLGLSYLETQANPQGPASVLSPWQYGYGEVNATSGKSASFQPFPHWTGDTWQFGEAYPHPEGSYLRLHSRGGHAGPSASLSPVLRWTAPSSGVVALNGRLRHKKDQGDGVRARLVSSRGGTLGTWIARNSAQETALDRIEVEAGETLDLIVDCLGNHGFDDYGWQPTIRPVEGFPSGTTAWNAQADFHGPLAPSLSPWEQYAQVLLMTNEFAYVD